MTFKNNNSPGYDIGPSILKEICPEITNPLAHIFNLSFTTGVVPDSLKLAKVIPVYKKGEKTNLEITDRSHYCQYLIKYWKN